jgi:D-serine deaminase-like pyridoxal phosphate-dependent protein
MSEIGLEVNQLDTPSLWVDLDGMERNLQAVSSYIQEAGVAWRPHTKGIKIPAIAHKLIDAGAIGITCAKLSEAEVMAAGGIGDILVANQVVGEQKIRRLCALRQTADDPNLVICGSLYLVGEAMELLQVSAVPARNERGLNEWSQVKQ